MRNSIYGDTASRSVIANLEHFPLHDIYDITFVFAEIELRCTSRHPETQETDTALKNIALYHENTRSPLLFLVYINTADFQLFNNNKDAHIGRNFS